MSTLEQPRAVHRTARTLVAVAAVATLALTLLVAAPAEARKRTRGHVTWGDSSLTSSKYGYAIEGKVSGGKGRTVSLQVESADGWHVIDRARTQSRGRFVIKGQLNWLGSHALRVKVPATRTFNERTFGPRKFTVKRTWRARGEASAHGFLTDNEQGMRFSLNPCSTIHYRVNPVKAGRKAIPFTKEAVRRIGAATGFTFKYVGRTRKVPFRDGGFDYPRGTDMVVAWSHQRRDPFLEGAVGVGGFQGGHLAERRASGERLWQTHRPGVTMNMKYQSDYPWKFSSEANEPIGLVLIHELGHAMGLAHYPDNIQIMHPGDRSARDSRWSALWEAGDLAGLRKNGAQPGCMTLVRGRGALSAPGQMLD